MMGVGAVCPIVLRPFVPCGVLLLFAEFAAAAAVGTGLLSGSHSLRAAG